MADKGEFRGVYVALVDHPDFQELGACARSCVFVLKLKLGQAGIAVFYPEMLPRYTGNTAAECEMAVEELVRGKWLVIDRSVWWLRNGLRFDPSEPLSNPNGRKGIVRYLGTLPQLGIVREFARYYGLEEAPSKPPASPFEPRITETETDNRRRNTDDGGGGVGEGAPATGPVIEDVSANPAGDGDPLPYVHACIVAANTAARDNPKVQPYRPLDTTHAPSYHAAKEWQGEGITIETAVRVIGEVGRAYTPSARGRQISSLAYFDAAVRNAHAADQADAVAAHNVVVLFATGSPASSTSLAAVPTASELQLRFAAVLADVASGAQRRFEKEDKLRLAGELVFGYWAAKTGQPNAKYDDPRERIIQKALRENGGDAGELLYVVDGALRDDWHSGRKDGTPRLGVARLFRDRATIEELTGLCPKFRQGESHPMLQRYRATFEEAA